MYKVGYEWCIDLEAVRTEPITEPFVQLNMGANFTFVPPKGDKIRGHIRAREPVSGKVKFEIPYPGATPHAGLLTAGGNVLFVPEADGTRVAHDACNGNKLWSHNNDQGHNGGIITYMVKGKQYVAVMTGLGQPGRQMLRRPVGRTLEDHAQGFRGAEGLCPAIVGTACVYNCRMNKGRELRPRPFIVVVGSAVRSLLMQARTGHGRIRLGSSTGGTSVSKQIHAFRIVAVAGLLLASALSGIPTAGAQGTKPFDVKATFRNICGFCHEDYGRKAGKAPQLMNSERTDQELANRIKNGLPGRMAAFGSGFNDDQIGQIVKFIRNLKPGVEPQNP